APGWTGRPPPAGCRPGQRQPDADAAAAPPHAQTHLRHDHARRRGGPAGRPDRCPARRPAYHMRYDRASNQLDRHPNCILAAYMATEPDAPIRDQDHRCIRPSPARADEWGATLAAMSSMYGLSPETDLSPLNGCMLTFVGFGQYQLQLAFSGDADCSI